MKRKQNDSQVRRVAAMLAIERDSDRVVEFCHDSFQTTTAGAKALIKEARALLALAADIDVREELGRRKEQLEDLRERARDAGDLRVELSTIQELSKLCDLYGTTSASSAAADVESATVALARAHLEGLGIVPKGLPIEELARQIAAVVMNDRKT